MPVCWVPFLKVGSLVIRCTFDASNEDVVPFLEKLNMTQCFPIGFVSENLFLCGSFSVS